MWAVAMAPPGRPSCGAVPIGHITSQPPKVKGNDISQMLFVYNLHSKMVVKARLIWRNAWREERDRRCDAACRGRMIVTRQPLFSRWDLRSSLMHRMIDRLNISFIAACLEPGDCDIEAIAQTCRACGHAEECQAWLDRSGIPEERYAFCPHAVAMDQLPKRD